MKLKDFLSNIFKKLGTLFHVVKQPTDWSSTSFLSIFATVVPIIVWTIMCFVSMAVLAIPESVVAIIIVGITGKVLDRNNKMKSENGNGK